MHTVSLSGKNCKLKKYNDQHIKFIKQNFFLDEITSKLLSIRNIKKDEINSYLNPSIKNLLPNPNNLIDMEKSTQRLFKAIVNNEKIGIFGDYDVDGATSTALLGNFFSEINLDYVIYIPDVKRWIWTINKSFKKLIDKNKLIFTVDVELFHSKQLIMLKTQI